MRITNRAEQLGAIGAGGARHCQRCAGVLEATAGDHQPANPRRAGPRHHRLQVWLVLLLAVVLAAVHAVGEVGADVAELEPGAVVECALHGSRLLLLLLLLRLLLLLLLRLRLRLPGRPKLLITPIFHNFPDFFPFSPGLLAVFPGFLASRR